MNTNTTANSLRLSNRGTENGGWPNHLRPNATSIEYEAEAVMLYALAKIGRRAWAEHGVRATYKI